MQALSALKELEAQSRQLQNRRQATSQKHFEEGLQALARAIDSAFRNKRALAQALELWMEAMRNNRRDPEPCSGIGYIFLLLGDTRMAIRYFQAALAIDPQHADSRRWLDHIQEQASLQIANKPAARTSPAQADSEDPEEALQALEDELFELLKKWMEQALPVPGKAQHERIVKYQTYLQKTCQRIQSQLLELEEELDVGQARNRLLALETVASRYRNLLRLSEQFIALEEQIMQDLDAIKASQAVLEAGQTGPTNADIERWLDRCDRFADQQDEWDQQGHDVSALETVYQKLVNELERLQDRMDEI